MAKKFCGEKICGLSIYTEENQGKKLTDKVLVNCSSITKFSVSIDFYYTACFLRFYKLGNFLARYYS